MDNSSLFSYVARARPSAPAIPEVTGGACFSGMARVKVGHIDYSKLRVRDVRMFVGS